MLKVMTLNLNYYGIKYGLWPVRRELIRQVIETAKPDIIALQAVESDPAVANGLDQATQLAHLIPEYHYVLFQPAQRTPTGGAQGSAFLARIRIADSTYQPLTKNSSPDDPNRRVLLAGTFDLATGPIHVFNAYFSWSTEQARANIAEAISFINSFDGRALLVGDFNNTSETEPMQSFKAAGWTDVWANLQPGENGLTFEAGNPTIRIDYAWVNHELKPYVRAIEIIANQKDASGAQPSDHFGLLVTLDLKVQ